MSTRVCQNVCIFCLVAIAMFVQAQAAELRPDWKPGVAGKPDDIISPVYYMDDRQEYYARGLRQVAGQMIVLVNETGAAAVRFTAGESQPGIAVAKYEYRYESFDGQTEITGSGELYEQANEAGVMGGNVHLTIVDLSIGWSYADEHCGWIYYTPEKMKVHHAAASLYSSRDEPGLFGNVGTIPALDLQRFKPSVVSRAVYSDPTSDTKTRVGYLPQFGPAFEHVITHPSYAKENYILDLDSGEFIDAPSDILEVMKNPFDAVTKSGRSDEPIKRWAKDSGADLRLTTVSPEVMLTLYGGAIIYPTVSFANTSADEVLKQATETSLLRDSKGETLPPMTMFNRAEGDDDAVLFQLAKVLLAYYKSSSIRKSHAAWQCVTSC